MAQSKPSPIPVLTNEELERFFSYIEKGEEGDCWKWTGGTFSSGYGCFSIRYHTRQAHRISYAIHVGDTESHLDHICHKPEFCAGGSTCPHRRCVNPAHLKPATIKENVLRGGGITAKLAVATHCVNGHLFDEENTVHDKKQRRCKQCARDRSNAYRKANHEEVLERKRQSRKPIVHVPIPCKICGAEFVPIRSTATTCLDCRNNPNPVRREYQRNYMRERRKKQRSPESE